MVDIKCAECGCTPLECKLSKSPNDCPNCTWDPCCCWDQLHWTIDRTKK
jgi:hypothetical protein